MTSDVLTLGLAGFGGAILGALVRPFIEALLVGRRQKIEWKREALEEQLRELYRPLYENFVIMPHDAPEHYFSDWEDEEFQTWLTRALDVMIPKLHLLPDEVLGRIHTMRESLGYGGDEVEREVRWLYKHIDAKFNEIRKQLGIS